jgi:hypothetical protein
MRSVADELRQRDRWAVLRLSAEERVALAFRLGELDLEIFCDSQGIDRATGIRRLRRRRQLGRTPSACMSLEAD